SLAGPRWYRRCARARCARRAHRPRFGVPYFHGRPAMPSNVLLVPGEAPDAADLADRIRDDEWTVLVAHDADQASDLVRSSPASLRLVDAGVWEAPSFRTTIAGRAPSLPVVVLTGGNEPSEVLVKHLKLGAATFIPKSSSKRE